MILGQSAALAAMLATESNRDVQEIDFAELKKRMLAQSQILSRKPPKGTRSANLA